MRVLVTGSRTWTDRDAVFGALDLLADAARYNGETMTVVHGAAVGADTIADEWVRERASAGWPVEVERFPADWVRYKRRAGYVRNVAMVRAGADACVAFVQDGSKGATHCATEAEAAGIPTQWVRRDDPTWGGGVSAQDPQKMAYPQTYPPLMPLCVCGHLAEVHFISERTKERMDCSAHFGGRCRCKQYTPEVSGG